MKKFYLILSLAAVMLSAAIPAVQAMPEPNIQEITTPDVELKVIGHRLDIVNHAYDARQVVIYALTGQVVKQLQAAEGTTTVDLAPGYYIVKVDKLSRRIVIR